MPLDLPSLLAMIRDSVAAPRDVAARLLALRLDRWTALEVAGLVAAMGALLVGLVGGGTMTLPLGETGAVVIGPLGYAVVLVLSLLLSATALHLGGRVLGGQGSFDQALVMVVWLEVVALAVRILQLLAFLLVPFAAPLLGLAGIVVLVWCLLNFVRVLHGFDGFGRPVLTLLLGGVGVGLGLTLLLVLVGTLGGIADV